MINKTDTVSALLELTFYMEDRQEASEPVRFQIVASIQKEEWGNVVEKHGWVLGPLLRRGNREILS